ncbi:MAG: M10 family metallopeptidase C-terminal domain-containing protein, partial [Hyphomonadaceae bacterium]|nr:M10 family metallopeptidase C-terminal domain-containing protein [Hyphomonadaceae bacterium]
MSGTGPTWNWVNDGRAVWTGAHAQFAAAAAQDGSPGCGCLGCAMAKGDGALTYEPSNADTTLAWAWDYGQTVLPNAPQEVNEPGDVIPGNTTTTFTLTLGQTETGVVNVAGDDDWFAVTLVAGQHYTFTMAGSGGTPLQDPYLELYDETGILVHFDDDDAGGDLTPTLRFTPATSGTYYINARAWEATTGPTLTGGYTISFNAGTAQDPLTYIDLPYTFPGNTIAVWFAISGEVNSGDTALRNWTQAEMDSVWSVLSSISAVANINFVAAASNAAANFVLSIADLDPGVLGHFFVGVGDGAFAPDGFGWNSAGMAQGTLGYATITHEILHGLGLGHPHYDPGDDIHMQGVTNAFNSFGTFGLNQGVFTTMSYNDGWSTAPMGNGSNGVTGSQAGPMALDIAHLQALYGANTTYNNGANIYTLANVNSAYLAIWDTGGTDAISYSGSAVVTIDLRPATLQNGIGGGGYVSFVSGIHGGYTIAAGALIENAVGGTNWDTLIGNTANNRFTGNAGFDTISGGAGVDTSVYSIASTSSSWSRNPDGTWSVTAGAEGTDTLTSV